MSDVVSTVEQVQAQRTATRACFRVLGFSCSHDELSNTIGLEPTRTWRARASLGWRHSWALLSRLPA